jgi:flavin-dependent dehydrogenase
MSAIPPFRDRCDALVVGGGPAGTATGLLLARRGYSVVVAERSHYERWRVGETLPPHAQPLLAEIGLWERFQADGHLASYAIHAYWGSDELHSTDFIFSPYGRGWHLDRKRFDAMLATAAEAAGAFVLRGAQLSSLGRRGDGWQAALADRTLEARFVVDASGCAGAAVRHIGVRRIAYDRTVAIAGMFGGPGPELDPLLILEAVEHGWWYSVPLPGGALLAVFVTDGESLQRARRGAAAIFDAELARTTHTAARAGRRCAAAVRVCAARSARLERAAGPSWLAVGDAATAFDPLSATGISKALRWAQRAAAAIDASLCDRAAAIDEYAESIDREFATYLAQRTSYYRREQRWPDSPFWRRRHVEASPVIAASSAPAATGRNPDLLT